MYILLIVFLSKKKDLDPSPIIICSEDKFQILAENVTLFESMNHAEVIFAWFMVHWVYSFENEKLNEFAIIKYFKWIVPNKFKNNY